MTNFDINRADDRLLLKAAIRDAIEAAPMTADEYYDERLEALWNKLLLPRLNFDQEWYNFRYGKD